MKLRDIILFVSIFLVLSLIAGGTYAYFNWRSATNKSVVFNTTKELQEYVEYNEGDSHFVGDFQPKSSFCDSISNTVSIRLNTANMTSQELSQMNKGLLVFSIKMDVNYIGTNTSASPNVHWVVTAGDTSSCPGSLSSAVAHGTFQGVSTGDTITVLENDVESDSTTISEIEKKYTVWIWIDSSAGSSNNSLSGETIDVNIWSQIDMLDPSIKNAVVAISGMNTIKSDGSGNVLTAVFDENVHDPNETYTYQWYSNTEYNTIGGEPISGATQSTFTLTSDLVGKYVYLVATSSKGNKMTSITDTDNYSYKTRYEVDAPTNSLCVSATYNGSVQTITNITSAVGYSLSNTSQTNAGTYAIKATLNTDYIWSDHTENEKIFTCSITKATPVVTLAPTTGSVMANQVTTFVATVKSGGGTVSGTVTASSLSPTYATVNTNLLISGATTSGKSTTLTVSGLLQGASTITVSFLPSDTTNYNSSASKNYSVTVTPAEYNITYNACSGTGVPSSQIKPYASNITLSSTEPTRTGYFFLGWSTSSCTGSVSYQPGDTYSTNASATMYAVWEAGTAVNAERWNIKAISSYNRVTKYYVTYCNSTDCMYSAINGITQAYSSTYAFSSSVSSTGKTPSPISTTVPGIGSDYKPTWIVASSALQYTSTASVRSSGKFNTATAQNYIVCRDIASTTGTKKTEWAVNAKFATIRTTFKYDNSGTNWWYHAEKNCFLKGDVAL